MLDLSSISDLGCPGASFCLSSCHVLYAECFFMPLFSSPSPSSCFFSLLFRLPLFLWKVWERKYLHRAISERSTINDQSDEVQLRINKSTNALIASIEWTKDQQVSGRWCWLASLGSMSVPETTRIFELIFVTFLWLNFPQFVCIPIARS